MATLETLYSFTNMNGDGRDPPEGLVMDSAGNLFGTTDRGGTGTDGTVFELAFSNGSYASTLTILATFDGDNGNNFDSEAGLFLDASGNLLGTTPGGGANGLGTVFEIPKSNGSYGQLQTLVSFDRGANTQDPAQPYGGLAADSAGNLFGTTKIGGGPNDDGAVFQIAYNGGSYASTATTVASFDGTNGLAPQGALLVDAAGDLFGTTTQGTSNGDGAVFEIPLGSGTPVVLASFDGDGSTPGESPHGGLIFDQNGDLFGTTYGGGSGFGWGTVFEIPHTSGGFGALTPLVEFNFSDGGSPLASLLIDANGNLFGTTQVGGAHGFGTVFEIPFSNGSYAGTPTTLVDFTGQSGSSLGNLSQATLIADSGGNLYGTTYTGGTDNLGTLFEVVLANSPNPLTVSHLAHTQTNNATDLTTGETVTITLTMSEQNLKVTGTPGLMLSDGANAGYSASASNLANGILVFTYTVAAGQNTSNLKVTGTTSGTWSITDQSSNAADFSSALAADLALKIDTTAPTITAVSTPSHGSIGSAQTVEIDLAVSEDVTVANGVGFTLKLSDGATATYDSGDSTATKLAFDYTTAAGQHTTDLKTTGLVLGKGTTVTDGAGNELVITGAANKDLGIVVDTVAPVVTDKLISDTGASNIDKITSNAALTGTGGPGATVHFVVNGHSEAATVTANSNGVWTFTPTTDLVQGSNIVVASETDAASNTGSASLTFTFDNVAPTVHGTSSVPDHGGIIGLNGTALIKLDMGEALKVTGAPSLSLSDGGTANFLAASSDLSHGILAFSYKAAAIQTSSDLSINSVVLANGVKVTDLAGNAADFTLNAFADLGLTVDTTVPTVSSVGSLTAANTRIPLGQSIEIDVHTSEVVTVANAAGLTLKLSDGGVATYVSGSGSDTLAFLYTAAAGQNTTAHLKTAGLTLAKGTTVTDEAGNALTIAGAANQDVGVVIDTNAPKVTGVTVSPATVGAHALANGDHLSIVLTLRDATVGDSMLVTGSPTLQLNDGGIATLTGHTATTLTFDYHVVSESTTDLKITGFNFDNANSVTDSAGNLAVLPANLAVADLKFPVNVFTWSNASGGEYNTDTNWTPDGVPVAGNTAVLPNSPGKGYTVTVNPTEDGLASHSVGTLVLAKNATLAISEGGTSDVVFNSTAGTTNAGAITITSGHGSHAAFAAGTDGKASMLNNTKAISIRGDNASIEVVGNVTLNGGGAVNLFEGASVATDGTHAGTLDNIDNTITFFGGGNTGSIGHHSTLAFTNEAKGVVFAEDPLTTLTIDATGGLTNLGTLKSSSAGGLEIILSGTAVNRNLIEAVGVNSGFSVVTLEVGALDNSSGTLLASASAKNSAVVEIGGSSPTTVTGGTFKTTGLNTAIDVTNADTTISGVKNTGALLVGGPVNHDVKLTVTGAFANTATGVITLDGSHTYNAELFLTGARTFSGGNKINMMGADAIIDGDSTLTNTDYTILGAGHIGNGTALSLINQTKGVINANGANALNIDGTGPLNNAGLMEATGTGGLVIDASTVTGTGGVFLASGSGAHVDFTGVAITGGTLKTANGGTINVFNTSAFDGRTGHAVTSAATVQVKQGGELDLFGSITNTGTITIGEHTATVTLLAIDADTILAGAGHIVLAGDTSAHAEVLINTGTLTNMANTFSGTGQFGFGIVHNAAGGTIIALAGDDLVINTTTIDNDGKISASGSGHLHLDNATIHNSATGVESTTTAGATLDLVGTDIDHGSVSIIVGSSLEASGNDSTITASKITNAGTMDLLSTDLTVSGSTFTNSGTISADNSILTINGNITNSGALVAKDHGSIVVTGTVSGGTALLGGTTAGSDDQGIIEFGGASAAKVTFGAGGDGTLMLDAATTTAAKFTGNITGFDLGDNIDLGALTNDPGNAGLSYHATGAHAGTLTVDDHGGHIIALNFIGDYTVASFLIDHTVTTHVDLLHV